MLTFVKDVEVLQPRNMWFSGGGPFGMDFVIAFAPCTNCVAYFAEDSGGGGFGLDFTRTCSPCGKYPACFGGGDGCFGESCGDLGGSCFGTIVAWFNENCGAWGGGGFAGILVWSEYQLRSGMPWGGECFGTTGVLIQCDGGIVFGWTCETGRPDIAKNIEYNTELEPKWLR